MKFQAIKNINTKIHSREMDKKAFYQHKYFNKFLINTNDVTNIL